MFTPEEARSIMSGRVLLFTDDNGERWISNSFVIVRLKPNFVPLFDRFAYELSDDAAYEWEQGVPIQTTKHQNETAKTFFTGPPDPETLNKLSPMTDHSMAVLVENAEGVRLRVYETVGSKRYISAQYLKAFGTRNTFTFTLHQASKPLSPVFAYNGEAYLGAIMPVNVS